MGVQAWDLNNIASEKTFKRALVVGLRQRNWLGELLEKLEISLSVAPKKIRSGSCAVAGSNLNERLFNLSEIIQYRIR